MALLLIYGFSVYKEENAFVKIPDLTTFSDRKFRPGRFSLSRWNPLAMVAGCLWGWVAGGAAMANLDEAIFWIALTIFGTGLYLVSDQAIWGGIMVVVGLGGLLYSLRQHLPATSYKTWIVVVSMAAATASAGYDIYLRGRTTVPLSVYQETVKTLKGEITATENGAKVIGDALGDANKALDKSTATIDQLRNAIEALTAERNSLKSRLNAVTPDAPTGGVVTVRDRRDCPPHYMVVDSNQFSGNHTAIKAPPNAHICIVNNAFDQNGTGLDLEH
jgi:hypothetical protein